MAALVSRYSPSRHYLVAGFAALGLAALAAWASLAWPPALIAACALVAIAVLILAAALRPGIEILDSGIKIGARYVAWRQIRRLDRTSLMAPLVVRLTLEDGSRLFLVYPGDIDSSTSLLRQLVRHSVNALIDGIPYRQYWGEALPADPARASAPPRYRLLRPEDEAEVERMFAQLKAAGRLDPKRATSEE